MPNGTYIRVALTVFYGIIAYLQIMIGRHGSCAEIGVIAVDDISRGECLAVIPRRLLLSCANSDIADLVSKEKQLMEPTISSWLPLLIAIAAECTKKVNFDISLVSKFFTK